MTQQAWPPTVVADLAWSLFRSVPSEWAKPTSPSGDGAAPPAATADSGAEQPMDTRAVPDAATPTSPTGHAAVPPAATADSAAVQPMDTRAVPEAATPTSPTGVCNLIVADLARSLSRSVPSGWATPTSPTGDAAAPPAATADSTAEQPMDTWAVFDASTPTSPTGDAAAPAAATTDSAAVHPMDTRAVFDAATPTSPPGAAAQETFDHLASVASTRNASGAPALATAGWAGPVATQPWKSMTWAEQLITVRVQNCRAAIQALYDGHQELFNFDMAATCRPVAGRGGARESLSLTTILVRKQQVDEPEFWHIIANMTGRVIQLYVSWPLEDMYAGRDWHWQRGIPQQRALCNGVHLPPRDCGAE
ncbi:hypothetical protein CYMTET_52854 [Cymbomonas tetramitiformis]|uniref:Uncharacterized protein n=1 Tax=Cymbomonas tetramitiformis TaxID=36881 RepID=A0AAE0BJX2_9CHLO|nr:hypothetical protein CYMTET_52854 [Cymbomonas tetramitiformis]